MLNFREYLKKNLIQKTTLYFAGIMIILNIGIFFVNRSYELETLLRKEEAFVSIIEHISSENDLSYVIKYMEHYSHIHSVSTEYIIDNVVVFTSELVGDNYSDYLVSNTSNIVRIDSSKSTGTILANVLLVVTNALFIIVYIVSIYIFFKFAKNKSDIILKDLDQMIFNIKQKRFVEHDYSFEEFNNLFAEFKSIYLELADAKTLKKEYLQRITHDLKTSLSVISTYLEGAMNDRMDLDKDSLKELLEEVRFHNDLIESLSGEREIYYENTNISIELSKICDNFIPVFDTKNIVINKIIEENVIVKTDLGLFNRIIHNVLSNSYYYSEENTSVTVSLTKSDDLIIKISDEGIGIPNEYINKVFEKDFRVTEQSHRNKKGNGLGLYTVKLLVEGMGGKISLDSNENGTTATILFNS